MKLAKILYAKDFFAAWQYVPFLLVSGVFNAASGIIGPILNANKNSKSLGTSSLAGAVVNIILNFVLIKLMGVQGAAVATAVSSYVIYLLRKIAARDNIQIGSSWKIYCSWALIITQAIVCIYTGSIITELVLIAAFMIINLAEIKALSLKMISIRHRQ